MHGQNIAFVVRENSIKPKSLPQRSQRRKTEVTEKTVRGHFTLVVREYSIKPKSLPRRSQRRKTEVTEKIGFS